MDRYQVLHRYNRVRVHRLTMDPANFHRDTATLSYQYYHLQGSLWGVAAEAALHGIRLTMSSVFDELPRLRIVLGHLGEGLPYFPDEDAAAAVRQAEGLEDSAQDLELFWSGNAQRVFKL